MLKIIRHPHPILSAPSVDIAEDVLHSPKMQKLIDELIPTMYAAEGIGLAAPQVGEGVRLCIIGKAAHESLDSDLVLVNPVWAKTTRKHKTDVEGCLSIPKTFGKVRRWRDIRVEAIDRNGIPLSFEAHDFLARVIQHEVDHLAGVLFIDKARGVYQTE